MGTTPADTLSEIEGTKRRLEGDLAVLQSRLPDPDELRTKVRTCGIAAGAGTAVLGLTGLAWSKHRDTKRREKDARALAQMLPEVLPEVVGTTVVRKGGGATSGLALVTAAAALALAGWQAVQQRRQDA